jgi:hypothetical protein
MAALGGVAVLFGGLDGSGTQLNGTWLWNGTSWSQPTIAGAIPATRSGAAMATFGSKIVLFGGCCGPGVTNFADTWLWDGSAWTVASVMGAGPSGRTGHAMAPLGGKVVLFGGATSSTSYLGDTWLWDGTSWAQATVPGPSARTNHVMATVGNRVVLFGGEDTAKNVFGDTWVWDGSAWSCASGCTDAGAAAPSGRQSAALATLGGNAVLFGGDLLADGPSASDTADTWLWNGAIWSASSASGPSARKSHAMAALP